MTGNVISGVNTLFNNRTLRKALLYLRFPLGLAVAAAILWYARRPWFWPAFAVSLIGAMGHWWCFACIKTQKELAYNGPYMLVRNPMYLARYIMIVGMILFTGQWILVAFFTVPYLFYMVNRVKREEEKLRGIFGAPYEHYCANVPRFIPTLRVFPAGKLVCFRWDCFARNRGYWNFLAVMLFYAAAYYRVFLWRQP